MLAVRDRFDYVPTDSPRGRVGPIHGESTYKRRNSRARVVSSLDLDKSFPKPLKYGVVLVFRTLTDMRQRRPAGIDPANTSKVPRRCITRNYVEMDVGVDHH